MNYVGTIEMRLVFPGIPKQIVHGLETEIEASQTCPLKEFDEVEIVSHAEALVFKHGSGFSFYRYPDSCVGNDVDTCRAYINDTIAHMYMPAVYEVTANTFDVCVEIRSQFENKYGSKLANRIDMIQFTHEGTHFVIVMMPFDVIRTLMKEDGGRLITLFRGKIGNLRKLPSFAAILPEDLADEEIQKRVFGTQYDKGMFEHARGIHCNLIQEVVRHPNLGICVGPIASWLPNSSS